MHCKHFLSIFKFKDTKTVLNDFHNMSSASVTCAYVEI